MLDLAYSSLETITAFDLVTGNYLFTLDELQNATIEQSQDKSDITGKGGRKLSSLKRNKAVKISGANGLVSGGLMGMQTGCDYKNGVTEVLWRDDLIVTGHKATTSWKAIGTEGGEIENLYIRNADGSQGDFLTQDATADSGKFTYNPADKILTFSNDIADGTEIIVYYKRKIKADYLVNESDKYSGKCELYVDGLAEDVCGNVYHIQYHIFKADFDGNFSIELGENQTVHSFKAEALAGACAGNGNFFTYTVYGVNTVDDSSTNAA